MDRMLEIEEAELERQLEEGEISNKEFTRELNGLYREVRSAVEQKAQDAYDDVMNRY